MDKFLSLIGILAIMIGVLVAAWWFTRWISRGFGGYGSISTEKKLSVLDRIGVGRNQTLMVIRVGGRYFLIGSGQNGLVMLSELSAEEGALWEVQNQSQGMGSSKVSDFWQMIQQARKNKKG